jgi:ABC-type multidrug transport system fused ATPase/permease subunit
LLVFVTYMQGFFRPMRRLSRVAERAAKASSCVDRITDVLDQEPDIRDGAVEAGRFRGAIEFRDVRFGYGDDQPALRAVSFEAAPGDVVALVGSSGAGKSTIASLLPRLYDPTDGMVLIDGIDVREFTLRSLRDQISVVPQDGALFAATVRENIAYGTPQATDDEIIAAARAAQIHDHIAALPSGYDTLLDERGTSFSGGQRQRLAIARALVKDAPIVVLDEPTTGLDASSERAVLAALEQLLAGRTAIVIAHRLETIRRADQILVLEGGEIVERGTHEQLLVEDGRYRDLHALQEQPEPEMGRIVPFARMSS